LSVCIILLQLEFLLTSKMALDRLDVQWYRHLTFKNGFEG